MNNLHIADVKIEQLLDFSLNKYIYVIFNLEVLYWFRAEFQPVWFTKT